MKDFFIVVIATVLVSVILVMAGIGIVDIFSGTNERTLFKAWTKVHNAPLTFEEFTVLHKEGLLPE